MESNSLTPDYVSKFEKFCNLIFKKKYEWFKKIEISSLTIKESVTRRNDLYFVNIEGTIFVDEDWGYKSFREYHYSSPISEDILFGDIISSELGNEIRMYLKELLKTVIKKEIYNVSFSKVNVTFVDMNS